MIFTERTITVRKGTSTINESIILYRGDFQVGLKFKILDSKYKFLNGTNLIESEKATYAQLAVLKPKGDNIFSDIVRCSDGYVTFIMTKAMIDELEEVGKYSFQIRLFDANKESRVSIPPVEFGIEVREPVASEDHNNEVEKALTGYSIAKVTTIEEDVKVDTFGENGNYNKTNWETGDRITENKLNKVEDAIDTLNKNDKTIDNKIVSNYNVLNSIKADKDAVFTMANMGQDVKAAMTGGSVAVVGKNAVLTENVLDKAITSRKQTNITLPVSLELGIKLDTVAQTIEIPYQAITCGSKRRITNGITIELAEFYKNSNNVRIYYNIDTDDYQLLSSSSTPDESYTLLFHGLRGQFEKSYHAGQLYIDGRLIAENIIRKNTIRNIVVSTATHYNDEGGISGLTGQPLVIGNKVVLNGCSLYAINEYGKEIKSWGATFNNREFTVNHNHVLLWDLITNNIIVQKNNDPRPEEYILLLAVSDTTRTYDGFLAKYNVTNEDISNVIVLSPPKVYGSTIDLSKNVELYAVTNCGLEAQRLYCNTLDTKEYTLKHNQVMLWDLYSNKIVIQNNNISRPASYVLLAYFNNGNKVISDGLFAKYAMNEPWVPNSVTFSGSIPSFTYRNDATDGNVIDIDFKGCSMYCLGENGTQICSLASIEPITLKHNHVLLWDVINNTLVVQGNNTNRPWHYVYLAYYNSYASKSTISNGELLKYLSIRDNARIDSNINRIESLEERVSNISGGAGSGRNEFLYKNKLGLISHRGFHSQAPENSIKAISEAGRLGYEIVELDLQVTSDGVIVLMHDSTIDRTTNGSGRVSDYTYEQLSKFILDESFGGYDTDDVYRIPTFEEACAEARKYGMGINVDCSKITWTESVIRNTVSILKKYGIWSNSFFVLGNQSSRDTLIRLYPDANVTWLSTDSTPDANIKELSKYINGFITYNIAHITDDLIRAYGDKGIPIFIYGCNTLYDVYKHKNMGIRFVETDFIPEGSEI